jgi:hypothetical protein
MTANEQKRRNKDMRHSNVIVYNRSSLLVEYFRYYREMDKSHFTTCRMHVVRRRWMKKVFKEVDRVNCWLCGCTVAKDDATLDHYHQLRDGGSWDDEENFRVAHKTCNNNRDFLFPDTVPPDSKNPNKQPKCSAQIKEKFKLTMKLRRRRDRKRTEKIIEILIDNSLHSCKLVNS